MTTLPKTQRAWRVVSQGAPSEALNFVQDLPVPTSKDLKPDNVLIKVQAAALNPVDHMLMKWMPNFVAGRPFICAYEFSGTVVDGNGTEWQAGDEVLAFLDLNIPPKTRQGALAQYVFAPSSALVRRPSNTTPESASGILVVGQTAWQGLFTVGGLEEGQTLFVNGGSTAVGTFAIQLAKARGCRVVASASGKNEAYVRGLGADEFVETKYHVFFECAGLLDDLYPRCENFIAPGGTFVTVGPLPKGVRDVPKLVRLILAVALPGWLGGVRRKFGHFSAKPVQEDMKAICTLVEEGKVRPVVDSVFDFEEVLKAYERLMTGRATGKVVVRVGPASCDTFAW